ncbi:hypothetical protein Nepgr_020521 [Nepenthes gracilis]|uniref:Uncharacterized protein n=1 Tax=Nepenthes gracilis TaxID=150966 RepID=A0AAD3SVH1_NEPGR|nr:hypothetical protein Nepgr_020521 [Nepenthes gracilis]
MRRWPQVDKEEAAATLGFPGGGGGLGHGNRRRKEAGYGDKATAMITREDVIGARIRQGMNGTMIRRVKKTNGSPQKTNDKDRTAAALGLRSSLQKTNM